MKKLILLVFAIFVGMAHLLAAQTFGQATSAPEKTILLRELLRKMGDKYDCHFTIESGWKSEKNAPSLAGETFSSELREKSLGQELERLRKTAPNLTYKFDRHDSKIIHIIDARLNKEKSYAMENVIRNIRFDGIVFDLVNAIGQKGVSVSSRGAVDIYESLGVDSSTRVHVDEKKKSVRGILTNSLPLTGRGRVLWIAETELGKGHITYVRFLREFM